MPCYHINCVAVEGMPFYALYITRFPLAALVKESGHCTDRGIAGAFKGRGQTPPPKKKLVVKSFEKPPVKVYLM
jgi:hypothetical protein